MINPWRRLLLAIIIMLELAAATLGLWWFFRPRNQPPPATPSPVAAPTGLPTTGPTSIWLAPQLPEALAGAIRTWADQQPDELAWSDASSADFIVDWKKRAWAEPLRASGRNRPGPGGPFLFFARRRDR